MKIGALVLFERIGSNGTLSKVVLLAAWHSKSSLTWRVSVCWNPNLSGKVGPYFMRTHRYDPGLNFNAGLNLPLLGSFNVQTQPNTPLM